MRLLKITSLLVVLAGLGGCFAISSYPPWLQQQGETSGFIRAAVDDALEPGGYPSFCREVALNYTRSVSGAEVDRRDGNVTVRHSGRGTCKAEVMRRPGGGVEGVSGWQYETQ